MDDYYEGDRISTRHMKDIGNNDRDEPHSSVSGGCKCTQLMQYYRNNGKWIVLVLVLAALLYYFYKKGMSLRKR